jgi:predicted amidohydrolase YtcJ
LANPDLLVYNGRIYLQPDGKSRVEALAVTDGKVNGVGSKREISNHSSAGVETLDLKGRVAIPGLADSHVHLLGYGMLMRTLNLSSARSIPEIQKMLVKAASTRPTGGWIVGRGWDQEKLRERRYPNRSDADVVGNPVFIRRICGHVAVANSAALNAAGIDEGTSDPYGGEVGRDSVGRPNGVFKERALELVSNSIPKNEEDDREALVAASTKLLAYGVTSLHCIVEDAVEFKILRDLKRDGMIQQSINAVLPLSMLDRATRMEDPPGKWGDGFRIGGIKIFLDGSLGARTAALVNPYDDEPGSSGILTTSREQLLNLIERTRDSGLQLSLHAIGDKAVEMGIEALSEALEPGDCQRSRHRIEHASLVPPKLAHGMSKLGLVASVQPRFIYSDSWAEKRLGKERVRFLYPFKSMLRAGIRLAAGSDSPSDEPSPTDGLWSAVNRPGLLSDERLTTREALACYTTGAAYASFSEKDEGTLEVGKWANVAVLNMDPFECAPEELPRLRVVQTIVHGEVFSWN